jgi:dGTPase
LPEGGRQGRRVARKEDKAKRAQSSALYRTDDYGREFAGPGTGTAPDEPWRSDFRRDYARLIHSAAFRRLVGKTQLFSGNESDFFRNRLTHSLEVAQIAKSIANQLNATDPFLKACGHINTDLVEVAALAHDLGHPPFGHNGELALDFCMRKFGGFEGNAQSLRILARLEKKVTEDPDGGGVTERGEDQRHGLDLCMRTLAAVLKYDNPIPMSRRKKPREHVTKGYYSSEKKLVERIKRSVLGGADKPRSFKTIECQIMDKADDIAYSTYDLEDAFKAGFVTPLDMISASEVLLRDLADAVSKSAKKEGIPECQSLDTEQISGVLLYIFEKLVADPDLEKKLELRAPVDFGVIIEYARRRYRDSKRMAQVGYVRTDITSRLIGQFLSGVQIKKPNEICPALSEIGVAPFIWLQIEVLKRYTYKSQIMSPRLKVAELRGQQIVQEIFECLSNDEGHNLLPDDFREWYDRLPKKADKMRVICDFIAGMTDRYAAEFHARLRSESPQSIFKPI